MRRISIVVTLAVLAVIVASSATVPESGVLSATQRRAHWTGGPLTGAGMAAGPDPCPPVSCDDFGLTIDIDPGIWGGSVEGVAIRVEWAERNDDMDLYIYDSSGKEVAHSFQVAGSFEEVFLPAPRRGSYVVRTVAFDGISVPYAGRAWVAGVGVPLSPELPNTMRFGPPTIVDPQIAAGEPSMLVAPGGRVYVTAPTGTESFASHLWRSTDGAGTFELLDSRLLESISDPRRGPCSDAIGGGDADLIVDRTGRMYFADLEGVSANVAVSTDGGDNWSCNAFSTTTPLVDRPWLAPASTADGEGPNVDAYLVYMDAPTISIQPLAKEAKPFQIHLDVTTDGGSTWERRNTYARSLIHSPGRLFTARDGTLYNAFAGEGAVWLARSRDQGQTVTLVKVSQRVGAPGNIFVGGDTDEAGNVYIAWVDAGTFDVLYSHSADRGDHWSAPIRLNRASSETSVMPWVAAGRRGEVAVSWYGTNATMSADSVTPTAAWHAWVGRSRDGAGARPAFEIARISETPTHFGAVCVSGTTCDVASRSLLDFFAIDIADDGAIVAAYNDNARIQEELPQPYIVVSRQTGGLGLSRNARTAGLLESKGDARFPPRSSEAAEMAPLDYSSTPSATWVGNSLQISFTLSSVDDLAAGLDATNTVLGTGATWLVTWKANDRAEYAGMAIDRSGTPRFFGGDHPGTSSDFRVYPYLTYPEQYALTGRIIAEKKQVVIEVPISTFHLKQGDVLHGLQAFTLAGLPEVGAYLSQQVVDITPAQTMRVASVAPSRARTPRRAGAPPAVLPATGAWVSPLVWPAWIVAVALLLWLVSSVRPRRCGIR